VPRAFDRVVVVFNLHSTGDAEQLARDLTRDLAARAPDLPVQVQPTRYAGHARDLARDAAGTGCPLVVSVSGDGGYNEVVDGIMAAGTGTAVAAVLAAGNANDHRRATRQHPLVDAIVAGDTRRLDLLTLTLGEPKTTQTTPSALSATGTTDPADTAPAPDVAAAGGGPAVRYAHSYLGVGITPTVARGLARGGKGSLREVLTTLMTLARFDPVVLDTDRGRETFDSLIFANIAGMAKYATLSDNGDPDDGRFEVIAQHHTTRWRLLTTALRAASTGLGEQPTTTCYRFRTVAPTPLQIDGELIDLPATTTVTIRVAPAALTTVL